MTGHQDHAATGKTLKSVDTYVIDFKMLCKGIGVQRILVINAFDVDELEKQSRQV